MVRLSGLLVGSSFFLWLAGLSSRCVASLLLVDLSGG